MALSLSWLGWSRSEVLSEEAVHEYLVLCREVAELLGGAGVRTRAGRPVEPFLDERALRFRRHSQARRILLNLKAYRDSLQAMVAAAEPLGDDRRMLWRAMGRLGLRPPSDLMDRLPDGKTVQIYTSDNLLVFVNLKFFDYIEATVDEIFTIVWNEDSQRELKVTFEALHLIFKIKTGLLKKVFVPRSIPPHTAVFTFSGVRQKIQVDLCLAAPLFSETRERYYLVAQDTTNLPL